MLRPRRYLHDVVDVRGRQYEGNVSGEALTFVSAHHPELMNHPYWRDRLLLTLSVPARAPGRCRRERLYRPSAA